MPPHSAIPFCYNLPTHFFTNPKNYLWQRKQQRNRERGGQEDQQKNLQQRSHRAVRRRKPRRKWAGLRRNQRQNARKNRLRKRRAPAQESNLTRLLQGSLPAESLIFSSVSVQNRSGPQAFPVLLFCRVARCIYADCLPHTCG